MASQLVLGTVELGMRYGLNNAAGQPSREEAFSILDAALEAGISTFDTAYAYGNAEDILGEWLRARGNLKDVKIVSKLKPNVLDDYPDGTDAPDIVRKEIEKTLTRLGVPSIDGYLLHTPSYVHRPDVVDGLRKVKEEGLVRHVGVSVYDEPEALKALNLGLEYVQVPLNVFDRRFENIGFFEQAKKAGATVFARSPFLQGLLVMRPESVPSHLADATPLIQRFHSIVEAHGVVPATAALWFALEHSHGASVVFGVETLAQLREIIGVAQSGETKREALVKELAEAFGTQDSAIVNPSLWSAARKP